MYPQNPYGEPQQNPYGDPQPGPYGPPPSAPYDASQDPYGVTMPPLQSLPPVPTGATPGGPGGPQRRDPMRVGLIAALVVFLVAAAVLTGFLVWPKDDKPAADGDPGAQSSSSQQSGDAQASGSGAPSSGPSGDQFTPGPTTTAGQPGATPTTTKPPTTTAKPTTTSPPAPTPPPGQNGVSDQDRNGACTVAYSAEKVSLNSQFDGTDTGPSVYALTTLLAWLGYGTSPSDFYGPGAEQAAMAFQADYGLVVDGIVGPQTWPVIIGAAC